MALPDINIEQFFELIKESKNDPAKLRMVEAQAKDKPQLLSKTRPVRGHQSNALMLAISINNGPALKLLLECGGDMTQEVIYPKGSGVEHQNAFQYWLSSYRRNYGQYTDYSRRGGEVTEPDTVLPLMLSYLNDLKPDAQRSMFGPSPEGKYYFRELGNLEKNKVFDENYDEQPSLFERLVPYGLSFDILPEGTRKHVLIDMIQWANRRGAPKFFQFLKEHVRSIEGGEELCQSAFAPKHMKDIISCVRDTARGSERLHTKKSVEAKCAVLTSLLNEASSPDIMFIEKSESGYLSVGNALAQLTSFIIRNRGYSTVTQLSELVASKLDRYMSEVYPTLDDKTKGKIDDICREQLADFYDFRYSGRVNNPLYITLNRYVKLLPTPDEVDSEMSGYGSDAQTAFAKIINSRDAGIITCEELLTEIYRPKFYPNKIILTPAEREHIIANTGRWGHPYQVVDIYMRVVRKIGTHGIWVRDLNEQLKTIEEKFATTGRKLTDEPYEDVVNFFSELHVYFGEGISDVLKRKCMAEAIEYACAHNMPLLESARRIQRLYPRQEVLNVQDTLDELSRYIYQPRFVIRGRKAGLSDVEISTAMQNNNVSDYTIDSLFQEGLTFSQIVDSSIYWHMRRAGVIGPAPKDPTTGEPITESVRKTALSVEWNPLFQGDVEFSVGMKKYRLTAAVTSEELQRYGSYCRTCVGGEGFSMDCMAGHQQVYGLFDITDAKHPVQKGYARFRVTRRADPKAFVSELEDQEKRGTSDTVKRFVEGRGIVLNNRTAIQMDFITGFNNKTPPYLQKIFDEGMAQFSRAALNKSAQGRLTLPVKKTEDEQENILPTPEEMLGLDVVNEAEALRIFKLLEKTCAAVVRDSEGHIVDETGAIIENIEALYEGDRRVKSDANGSFFSSFHNRQQEVAGHSRMNKMQLFATLSKLDESIDRSIGWAKKGAKKDEGRIIEEVNFTDSTVRPITPQDRYYKDAREIQNVLNRQLASNGYGPKHIPQLFGMISIDDTLEAIRTFAEAYPNEVKSEGKRYAPEEIKTTIRKHFPDLNLNIIASYIIAKRGISIPFLQWKAEKDPEYLTENMRWVRDCKPLSQVDGIEHFVQNEIGEQPGITAFQSEENGKTFFALRPTSFEDMAMAVQYGQNSRTFPALIWGIPPKDSRMEEGDARPQWLVTPQFQRALEKAEPSEFHIITPPDRVMLKEPPVKLGPERGVEFRRPA